MKTLIFVSFLTATAVFAQVATQTDSSSTTVTSDHGKKSATDSASSTSVSTPAGTTTQSTKTSTKSKRKHGKVVSKSATEDSSSTTR
jgi:hypothetical protein